MGRTLIVLFIHFWIKENFEGTFWETISWINSKFPSFIAFIIKKFSFDISEQNILSADYHDLFTDSDLAFLRGKLHLYQLVPVTLLFLLLTVSNSMILLRFLMSSSNDPLFI